MLKSITKAAVFGTVLGLLLTLTISSTEASSNTLFWPAIEQVQNSEITQEEPWIAGSPWWGSPEGINVWPAWWEKWEASGATWASLTWWGSPEGINVWPAWCWTAINEWGWSWNNSSWSLAPTQEGTSWWPCLWWKEPIPNYCWNALLETYWIPVPGWTITSQNA